MRGRGHRLDARNRSDDVDQPVDERAGVAIEPDEEHAVGAKPRVDVLQVAEGAHEQARAGDEDQRERDLTGHERRQHAGPARRAAIVALQNERRTGRARLNRRRETEEQPRGDGERRGECEHVRVRRQVEHDVGRPRRDETHEEPRGPPRDANAERRARARQHPAFDEQLADDAPAAGADGQANRDLATAGRRARDEQTRDVRARDGEHQRGDAHEHHQRLDIEVAQVAPPGRPGLEHESPTRHGLLAGRRPTLREQFARQRRPHAVEPRLGGVRGQTRGRPGQNAQPEIAWLGNLRESRPKTRHRRDRRHDLRALADGRAIEAARTDANDRHRHAVDRDRFAYRRGATSEFVLPVTVADHGHQRRARLVVLLGQQASRLGLQPSVA